MGKNGLMGTFATLKLIFSDVFVKTEQFLADFRLNIFSLVYAKISYTYHQIPIPATTNTYLMAK